MVIDINSEANVLQIQTTLNNIRQKVNQCESLLEVFTYIQSNQPLPKKWAGSLEEKLILLYMDLIKICKENNIEI